MAISNERMRALEAIGLIELLEADQRPTFVLDLENVTNQDDCHLSSVFCNCSLRSLTNLQNAVLGMAKIHSTLDGQDGKKHSEFKSWSTTLNPQSSPAIGPPAGFLYSGLLWSRVTVRNRWRIISGLAFNQPEIITAINMSPRKRVFERKIPLLLNVAKSQNAAPDPMPQLFVRQIAPQGMWTDSLPLSQHTELFKAIDWSATALGNLESWPRHLRKMACFLMADSRPACILWGPQKVLIYNEEYKPIASDKHPSMMGSTFAQAWPESAYEFGPIFASAQLTGRATAMEDTSFFIRRHGYLEETFFSWNMIPLCEESGGTLGFYLAVFETTRQTIADRRTRMLISMTNAPDLSSFWDGVLQGFRSNELDMPLAVIYSLEQDLDAKSSAEASAVCVFRGALGIPENHASMPRRAPLGRSSEGFISLFKNAQTADDYIVLTQQDKSLPEHLFQGIAWRGFGEMSTTVIVFRLFVGSETFGFLLLGLNPRRAYDQDYERFLKLLSRQLLTSLTSAVFFEQAKLNEANLSKQLATRTREFAESEASFKAFADLVPAGVFKMSDKGEVLYANDTWYELTGHPKGLKREMSGMSVVYPEDILLMEREWGYLAKPGAKSSFEFRLNTTWFHEQSKKWKNRWVIASSNHQLNEDGSLKSIFGCVTDISHQKQAQEDALERARLSDQLNLRTQEVNESEKKFRQMAELAPCGIFYYSAEGTLLWANSQWYTMTGHSTKPEDHYPGSFFSFIQENDHELVTREFEKLTVKKEHIRFECRTKKAWIHHVDGKPVEETAWILCMTFPTLNEDGSIKNLMGCTADISHLKWAESLQMRSRVEAEEAKKSQEKFMDITSHEMRNPLSAILQSADDVHSSLIELRSSYDDPAAIDSILDSVQVISLCAQHQGRIINDVLTLSKLDSAMTRVTPDICQPIAVVKGNLRMFEGEVVTHRIELKFLVEDSYEQCKINWVTVDPSRLTQVFINIMTNAIKFTKSKNQRMITVTVGASLKKPTTGGIHGVEWFPSRDSALKKDPTSDPEWGDGEPVFLIFSVQDTGRGLSLEEKTRLFNRFSQANIRTHVEYGGSGLGLFISRELTELQGGEIGVVSVAGEGSTFAFYIKGRRTNAPKRVAADQKDRSSIKGSVGSIGKDRPALPKRSSAPTPGTVQPKAGTPMFEVLLVEDNLVNQKVLSKQLAKAGCIVSVANHGLEALDFLRKSKLCKANNGSGKNVDIVLMDLEMPVMDGLTCARHIRKMQSQCELVRHVPIIAVTANARKEQIEASIAGGMDDVMPKPFRVSELIPKIEKLLAAH